MKRFGQMLWWMDREDPRFATSFGAKLGFAIVWALGFLFLLAVAQLALYLVGHLGNIGRTGS